MILKGDDVMSILWRVIIALLISNFFGGLMVAAVKINMSYYKEEYSKFWTKTNYIIFYSFVIIITFFVVFSFFERAL
jgi:hypothetical protein